MGAAALRRPAIGPWTAIVVFILLWMTVMTVGTALRDFVVPNPPLGSPQDNIAFRLATSLPLSWIALGLTLLLARWRGQRPTDLGWRKPGSLWGWLAAFAVTAYLIWGSFRSPYCRGICFIDPHAWLTDWSPFRTLTSIAVGLTAGFCEEITFRGFVMTQARDGGAPVAVQIVLSGLLFGLAHLGIAGLSGHFDPVAAISVVASTTVFGAVFAAIYVLGRRSLTHVILAHGLFAFVTEPWLLLWTLKPH